MVLKCLVCYFFYYNQTVMNLDDKLFVIFAQARVFAAMFYNS